MGARTVPGKAVGAYLRKAALTREEFLDGIFEQLSNPNFEISWECLHEDATSIILKWRETHGEGVFENHLGLSFIEDGKFWRSIVKDV